MSAIVPVFVTFAILGGDASAEEPWEYFANPWTVVGLADYARGARIDPSREVLLGGDARMAVAAGKEPRPVGRMARTTLLEGWLPIVIVETAERGVEYRASIWATPLPTVKDPAAAFEGPVDGENFLVWIQVAARNSGPSRAPAGIVVELRPKGTPPRTLAELRRDMEPGTSESVCVRVPFEPIEGDPSFSDADPELWLKRTIDAWKTILGRGAAIEVPDRKARDCLRASLVYQLIGLDRGELHAGEGFYDEFYIRDGAYQVLHLEEAGLLGVARRAMEPFFKYQRPDGRFESQTGQLDANGQALWALWQHHAITGDRAWLERAFPAMRRSAAWIREARRSAPSKPEFAGLLPAAVADGEFLWEGRNHIVGYDLWNLRGLLCAADAARSLGETAEAEALEAESRDYRSAIDAAWKRTGLAYFPPSWEKDGTHWGNTETLWPTPIFDPADPRVRATMREVRERFGGGFLEGTIRWSPGRVAAIHPYLSSYTTLASLTVGEDERVVEEFWWYLLHSTSTHGFPEGIYYKRRVAWSDTVPHLLGAANYAILLRHMLLHEDGDTLHLLPAVPDAWLGPGKEIRIAGAPTRFGPVDLVVTGQPEGVRVLLSPPLRRAPSRIVLHAPASRRVLDPPSGLEVVVRPTQKVSWSFERVRAACEAQPRAKPIPGLVPLPRPGGGSYARVDLAPVANTDPFRAPFGVESPGRYVFTGLRPGLVEVEGVPFGVLDPASTGGKGLVVLNGMNTAATYPKEVVVPVGRVGKRVYFLGNVHGWLPDDDGAGEWNAIAEYVVEYADGTSQSLPLVPGRTTDDWAMPPSAVEAAPGLRGDPWHLNVLGLELRPVEVRRILFRDLGTPSSPVLVAMTLEV